MNRVQDTGVLETITFIFCRYKQEYFQEVLAWLFPRRAEQDKSPTWSSSAGCLFWVQWINIITDMNRTITTGKAKASSEQQLWMIG